MRPLVFLTIRSFVNGVKRSLSSIRRLIGLIFFVGYYAWLVLRPVGGRREGFEHVPDLPVGFQAPPLEALDGVVFGLFSLLSFVLVMNVMGYRGGFKPADVDVLFPTPINPRVVLVFRIVRDYLITLLLPLFFAIVGWQGVSQGVSLFRNRFTEQQVAMTFRAVAVAWILMALCWVSIGYAASLFVNRSDLQSDRNKRIIGYTIAALLLLVATYIGLAVRQDPSWETARELAASPVLRTFFFTATAATTMVMAPLEADVVQGLAGFGGLLLIIVGSFWVAMTQVDWLYDQAAARGFDTQAVRSLRQKGDMSGLLAEYARQGKVKPGRLAARVANWRVRGGLALLWKDLILQARSSMWSYAVFLPISIFMVAMPVWAVGKLDRASTAMYFLMQGFTVFMIAMQANSGVIEMLRRVDVQKPLPFTPAATVFWEIAAKALPPALISWIAGLCALAINPGLADAFLAAAVMAPSMSFLLVAVVYLMTVLFPDVDDPTQRGFRSLMLLLGIFLLSVPSVAMFLGLTVVGIPLVTGPVAPIAAALPFVLLNALLTFAVAAVTGLLYANFNPSE